MVQYKRRPVFIALLTSSPVLSRVVRAGPLEHRAATMHSTGQPLTITISLDYPTVTYTEATVTSAWGAYATACGPTLARAIQDGLVEYNAVAKTPATDINDPNFREWLKTAAAFEIADAGCKYSQVKLFSAEDNVASPTSSTTRDAPASSASSTSASPSSTTSSTASASDSSTTPSTTSSAPTSSPPSTSTAGSSTSSASGTGTPSPAPSNDAVGSNRPRMALSFVLVSVAFGLVW
ncbi:hypothetical protein C8R46DRAFT_1088479 [Mycena filopes]|nr:hypothetical protein C8R46DRAFT_1088479 [Mycena filopes]